MKKIVKRDFAYKVGWYFHKKGFDVVASNAKGGQDFVFMANNGVATYKVLCKEGADVSEVTALAEKIAQDQAARFKEVNHPIVIFVANTIKAGVPQGAVRLLVPKDTTVKGGANEATLKDDAGREEARKV